HAIDAKVPSDVQKGLTQALVFHDRSTRNDTQPVKFGQLSDERVCDAIGKVLLRCIPRQVFEGKNSNRVERSCNSWFCRPAYPIPRCREHSPCEKEHACCPKQPKTPDAIARVLGARRRW